MFTRPRFSQPCFRPSGGLKRKLLGNDDKSWGTQSSSKDKLLMQKFTAVTGTLGEIRIKCAGRGHVQVAIYSDNAGSPGTVLAYAMAVPIVSGWNTISLNTTVALTATYYWLAYVFDTANIFWNTPGGGTLKNKTFAYGGTFPDSPADMTNAAYDVAIAGWGL